MGNPTVTAKVVAKKGCKIRSERSLKSTCVALLAPGTLLSIEGCLDDARVATISPVAGFASLKTLRIVVVADTSGAPICKFATRQGGILTERRTNERGRARHPPPPFVRHLMLDAR